MGGAFTSMAWLRAGRFLMFRAREAHRTAALDRQRAHALRPTGKVEQLLRRRRDRGAGVPARKRRGADGDGHDGEPGGVSAGVLRNCRGRLLVRRGVGALGYAESRA